MYVTLNILGIFLGLFGFAFGLAGVVGMFNFERRDESALTIADGLFTGSIFTMISDVAENWSKMPEQRRFIWVGVICSALCVGVLFAARRIDEPAPHQPAAGKPGIASRLASDHHRPGLPELER